MTPELWLYVGYRLSRCFSLLSLLSRVVQPLLEHRSDLSYRIVKLRWRLGKIITVILRIIPVSDGHHLKSP
jgi:hypothetical protein